MQNGHHLLFDLRSEGDGVLGRGNGQLNNWQSVDAEGLDLGCDAGGQARLCLVEMLGQRLAGLVDVGAEVVLDDNNRDPLVRVGCHLLNASDSLDALLQRIGDIMLDNGGRCSSIHRYN